MTNADQHYIKMTETPVAKLILKLGIPTTVSMLITNITVSERTAEFHKGFVTREEELYERLKPYVPITLDTSVEGPICFCGTQKMRYVFQVMV